MDRLINNHESLLVWWLIVGLVLGTTIGYALDSLTVGVPTGMVLSLLVGTIANRVGRSVVRLRRY